MCILKRGGAFTEKHDFVNLNVLSIEISEVVCHLSFEIMGMFVRFSRDALCVEVQTIDQIFQTLSEIRL